MLSSRLLFSLLRLLGLVTLSSAQSLLEALVAAGANEFARNIQADPSALAFYTSPSVRTVFAVADTWYRNNATVYRRQSGEGEEAQQAAMQTCKTVEELEGNDDQAIDTSGDHKIVVEEEAGASNSRKLRRAFHNGTIPSIPLRVSSGLGLKSNILLGDIHYHGGLLHIVDSFFTFPESAEETINSRVTNLTTLSALLQRANLTDFYNNAPNVTLLTPSNEAFARALAGNQTWEDLSASKLQHILRNHIITGFEGYTPYLENSTTYTTLAGSKVRFSQRNGWYYVNDVLITCTNIVIDNGVAHEVDAVLFPSQTPTPPPIEYPGGNSGLGLSVPWSVVAALTGTLLFFGR